MSNDVSKYIKKIRSEYSIMALGRNELSENPFLQFEKWFEDALKAELIHPQSMSIATSDVTGQPSIRVVFLRGFNEDGFIFYTNYLSAKGGDLAQNNKICANFFWPELERQIKIEGEVVKLGAKDSDAYFGSRPKSSQIGAWASEQSKVIANRDVLHNRFDKYSEKYATTKVDRPEHWGGYLIKPHLLEFWQGRPSRLHDRFQYSLINSSWQIDRLAP